jgi:hypothetical protein
MKCFYFKHLLRREWIDYGGIKMNIWLDGDLQELYYHAHLTDWYKDQYNLFNKFVKSGDKVIDVGANYGFYAVLFSNLVGFGGNIYCFEPSKKNVP